MAKKIKKIKEKPLPEESIEKIKKTKIRVVGIGGGGGNIVSDIASRVGKASFVVANTDRQALRTASRKAIAFQFGENFTHGLGTGMNPQLAEASALKAKDRIKKSLEGQDLVILVATLGGGTGSGAAPIFAKISRSLGNLTFGIFTLPFEFEGKRKMEIAKAALEKLRPKLNAFTLIPNERIFQIIDKTTPLTKALSAINQNLSESLEGLIETIFDPGLINIDFADLRTILEGRGRLAFLNCSQVPKSQNSAKEALEKILNSPLYPYSIRGAKAVLLNIAGEKNLELSEISQISKTISDLASKETRIIFGISQSQKYQNVVKTTLLATGCQFKFFSGKVKRQRKRKKTSKKKEKTVLEKPAKKVRKELKRKREIVKVKRRKRKPERKQKKLRFFKKAPSNKTPQKTEVKITPAPEVEEKKAESQNFFEGKVRKNALQLKKEAEKEEAEMLAREKFWEIPAFLRRKKLIQ